MILVSPLWFDTNVIPYCTVVIAVLIFCFPYLIGATSMLKLSNEYGVTDCRKRWAYMDACVGLRRRRSSCSKRRPAWWTTTPRPPSEFHALSHASKARYPIRAKKRKWITIFLPSELPSRYFSVFSVSLRGLSKIIKKNSITDLHIYWMKTPKVLWRARQTRAVRWRNRNSQIYLTGENLYIRI